jgi:hypothetical protein
MNKKIIKIKKNDSGDVTDVMLSNGDIFPLNHAITMAKEGAIEGIKVGHGRNGAEFLETDSNDVSGDNLSNLPTF